LVVELNFCVADAFDAVADLRWLHCATLTERS